MELPADAELVPFSRWITPVEVKVRFDTWFFAAEAPAGHGGRAADGSRVRGRALAAPAPTRSPPTSATS